MPASFTMSALSASPPIARIPSPGVVPSSAWETFSLGCAQASTLDLTNLGVEQIVEVNTENGIWALPTLVSSKSAKLQPAEIILFAQENTVIANTRSSEIGFPPLPTLLETYLRKQHDDYHFNGVSSRPKQGLDLDDRSLTSLSDTHNILTMATTATDVPGSPPDLSGSRSSKSSSHSSTFSSPDGLDSDITNFEEIGLDDERRTPSKSCHSRDVSMQSMGSQLELVKTKEKASEEKRPPLPQLKTHVRASGPQQGSAPPRMNGSKIAIFKLGFNSADMFNPPISMRTRSSSPPNRRNLAAISGPSLSASGLRPVPHSSASTLGIPSRRASWQPQRKTVKELEAEYNDSDDDLPEDASLWNVPLSPLPGQRSHRSSFRGSPDRNHPALNPRPIPLEHSRTTPEVHPSRPALYPQTLPKTRPLPSRAVSMTPATSNPPSPRRSLLSFKNRTKSWNIAMADLSEEAVVLSEALEFHAEAKEQERLDKVQGGSSRGSLEISTEHSSRASSIQLPPIQKSALDFMPISKEKEAILSRTRPSWLPPKDPKEERRHLREFQRMMSASLEAEKKRRTKLQAQQYEKDDTRESLTRIWNYYIDEATDITNHRQTCERSLLARYQPEPSWEGLAASDREPSRRDCTDI